MKKFILILIASIGINFYLSAQHYRSIGNGNWNEPTTWQIFNGISWVAASTYPGQNPGTESVYIMNQTEIIITATVPNPVYSLFVDAEYGCSCDNYNAPHGKLIFSAESAISLTVTGSVFISGGLLINDQNGAKSHSIFIGGSLGLGGDQGWYDIDYYYLTPTVFQTINHDDKINFTFNTTIPNSVIGGSELAFGGVTFQDVTFSGIGIILHSVLVKGHANFINVKVSAGMLIFGDGATYSGVSAASYVEGSVTKQGNDAFTFPIGNGNVYAPLIISAPSDPGAIVSASYTRSNASDKGPISDPGLLNVSNCEYWVLYSNNNNLNVTVNWSPSSGCESSPYVTNVSEVTLAHFDNTTQRWNSHSGTGIGTTTNGSVTWNGLNSSGYFTLGNLNACNAPWGMTATNITSNSATLSWDAISGARYDVDYSSSGVWINAATATTNTSVNLSGLNSGSYYSWRIRTNCSSTSSPYRQAAFNTLCGVPSGLTTSNVTYNSATLNWPPVFNANGYTVEYKQSAAVSWTATGYSYNYSDNTLTGFSATFNELSASTGYDWRVRAYCSGSQGIYVQGSFTTTSQPPCSDIYESNNTASQAKSIALGNTISASISSSADIDWFKITTPNSANNSLSITLINLAADYDLFLYDKRLTLVAASTNTGTSNEVVTYNSNQRKAAYYIKVIGKNGAFNTLQCYHLLAHVSNLINAASRLSNVTNENTSFEFKNELYPNPASQFVLLRFNSIVQGAATIEIINNTGQLVKQHSANLIKGYNQVQILVSDIRPGMYILRINKGELSMIKKFVIAR